ncbi:outer membrane protein/peptidoglycan-associated (lipo)protein [Shewanella psychrophila]|uniref:Outer membrane protein/peptidoglycan-associated (Lipo)protein n=1 Tax=Shewanella psychrophila TaxID=225848 RepID=A0A1S6HRQ9_9GAMM|nr:OmpA family protein [Shewanella psychrophila]AQS38210.1 outer membrane protein/peptidoglycan-associated (lipo)protein [Shewanella psychrophila]
MKTIISGLFIALTLSLISGCAQTAEPYADQAQSRDLLDTDNDGVINARDSCSETTMGAIISNDGCPESLNQVQEKTKVIMFDFDSSQLSKNEVDKISELLHKLMDLPEAKLVLIGDTSPEGSDSYNHALAQRRVDTIHGIAKEIGFPTQSIVTQTYDQIDRTPTSIKGREHRLIAVGQWQVSGTQMMWNIFTSEQNSR